MDVTGREGEVMEGEEEDELQQSAKCGKWSGFRWQDRAMAGAEAMRIIVSLIAGHYHATDDNGLILDQPSVTIVFDDRKS